MLDDDPVYQAMNDEKIQAFLAFVVASKEPGALWEPVHELEMKWRRLAYEQTIYMVEQIRKRPLWWEKKEV